MKRGEKEKKKKLCEWRSQIIVIEKKNAIRYEIMVKIIGPVNGLS